jgi:hypothetical protein
MIPASQALTGANTQDSKYFEGWLEIHVTTHGARSQSYVTRIPPPDFAALAKEMVNANPEAAIKAFGAAMQEVAFPPKPQQDQRDR